MKLTEQDEELLEKLYSIFEIDFEIDCDYYSPTVQNGCGYDGFYCKLHTSMLDNAMQLITADRKRVALEARIGALDTIHKRLAASDLNTKHYKIISKMLIESKEGYREAMKQEPVAQLKAQQEEV